MALYRIYRMKDTPRENFRWAAHTRGLAVVKPRDYDFDGELQAATPYSAWRVLAADGRALRPGDLLETPGADGPCANLQIAKYIGFEPAQWFVPEPKPDCNVSSTSVSDSVDLISHSPLA
ncbi:MAG: hypothetical protein WB992_17055 [Bryobacteraceae bacterium]